MKSFLFSVLIFISVVSVAQTVGVTPVSATKCPTDSLVLRANASGVGVLNYRWYISTSPNDTLSSSDTLLLLNEALALHGALSTYICEVRDQNNTPVTSQSYVFVTAPIDFTVGSDTSKCPGDTVRIIGTSSRNDLEYEWNTAVLDNVMQEDTNAFYDVNKVGTFWVIASPPPSSGFCPALDSITVSSVIPPLDLVQSPTISCVGDTVVLSNQSSYPIGSGLLWSTLDIKNDTKIGSSGTYRLTITAPAPYNCVIQDSIVVTQTPYPTVSLLVDSTICFGDSIELYNLTAQSGVSAPSWSYSGSELDQTTSVVKDSIWVSSQGTYFLSISSLNGACSSQDSLIVSAQDLRFQLSFDSLYCDTVEIKLFPTGHDIGAHSYLWNSAISGDTLSTNTTSNHFLTITSSLGCSASNSIDLVFVQPVGYDLLLLNSDSSTISLNLNDHITDLVDLNYVWLNEDDDTIVDNNVNILFTEDGFYTLSTNHPTYDCSESFETEVTLTPDAVIYELFVPSAFSPSNSIVRNQRLFIEGNAVSHDNFSFKVYNKWGAVVYENESFSDMNTLGWDGTNNGNQVNSGTYTYTITGAYLNGEVISVSGSVSYFK